MGKSKQFFIIFRDTWKRDLNAFFEETKLTEVDNILGSIHYNLSTKYKHAGNLTIYSHWLVRNIPGEGDDDDESEADPIYRYGHYFKLDAAGEGYDDKMFCPKAVKKYTGF